MWRDQWARALTDLVAGNGADIYYIPIELLSQTFADWTVLKSTVQSQQYDIPREQDLRMLHTNVVSYVARK